MRDREKHVAHDMQYCQHYDPNGLMMIGGKPETGCCKAGVNYRETFGKEPGIFLRIPCLNGLKNTREEQLAKCPKWEQRTREQAEARADDLDAAMNRMRLAGPVVKAWRTWTPKNRVAKQEVVECPACNGKLHLSQAALNGHVWGQCETDGCLSWME